MLLSWLSTPNHARFPFPLPSGGIKDPSVYNFGMGCIFVVGGYRAWLVSNGFVLRVAWVVGKMFWGNLSICLIC
jgi:hypothetical protein